MLSPSIFALHVIPGKFQPQLCFSDVSVGESQICNFGLFRSLTLLSLRSVDSVIHWTSTGPKIKSLLSQFLSPLTHCSCITCLNDKYQLIIQSRNLERNFDTSPSSMFQNTKCIIKNFWALP